MDHDLGVCISCDAAEGPDFHAVQLLQMHDDGSWTVVCTLGTLSAYGLLGGDSEGTTAYETHRIQLWESLGNLKEPVL